MRKAPQPGAPRRINLKVTDPLLKALHQRALDEERSLQEMLLEWVEAEAERSGHFTRPQEEQA